MPQSFGSLVFTSAVKALQERCGSRRQYERLEERGTEHGLTEQENEFLAERDSFYIATVGATGWPYNLEADVISKTVVHYLEQRQR